MSYTRTFEATDASLGYVSFNGVATYARDITLNPKVGLEGGLTCRAFAEFDISSLDGKTIESAQLMFTIVNALSENLKVGAMLPGTAGRPTTTEDDSVVYDDIGDAILSPVDSIAATLGDKSVIDSDGTALTTAALSGWVAYGFASATEATNDSAHLYRLTIPRLVVTLAGSDPNNNGISKSALLAARRGIVN